MKTDHTFQAILALPLLISPQLGCRPPACLFSTAVVLAVDEVMMIATFAAHYIAPAGDYSFFGGQVGLLANADIEAPWAATCASP